MEYSEIDNPSLVNTEDLKALYYYCKYSSFSRDHEIHSNFLSSAILPNKENSLDNNLIKMGHDIPESSIDDEDLNFSLQDEENIINALMNKSQYDNVNTKNTSISLEESIQFATDLSIFDSLISISKANDSSDKSSSSVAHEIRPNMTVKSTTDSLSSSTNLMHNNIPKNKFVHSKPILTPITTTSTTATATATSAKPNPFKTGRDHYLKEGGIFQEKNEGDSVSTSYVSSKILNNDQVILNYTFPYVYVIS